MSKQIQTKKKRQNCKNRLPFLDHAYKKRFLTILIFIRFSPSSQRNSLLHSHTSDNPRQAETKNKNNRIVRTDNEVFEYIPSEQTKIHQTTSSSLTDHTVHLLTDATLDFFTRSFLLHRIFTERNLRAKEKKNGEKKLVVRFVSLRTFILTPHTQCDASKMMLEKIVTIKKSNTHTNPVNNEH